MNLEGKTALVTGSSRGIGRALVEALAGEGLGELLAGVRDGATAPAGARPVELDLSSPQSIERAAAGLPPLDLLVNNAGVFTGGPLEGQPVDQILEMAQVNVAGVMHLTRLVLPGMLERGSGKIVNQASVAGYVHAPGNTTYGATKAAVVAFSNSLRRELADTGVSVLELATPGIDTDMWEQVEREMAPESDYAGQQSFTPEEYAEKIVEAIASDDEVLSPGKSLLTRVASGAPRWLLDAVLARNFDRQAGP